ncbi:peptidylprolyl isomerase [Brevundimonas basaltis]|uniref:peptidylprolyl isomerase n=1 Tax=Brevundimonas basaltis TaxID=472166 RepID=A0A7W8MG66_9CAUL|nr:peptidylprolyl isomerase [Brevundimonas basaltis]MBB5291314.1 peptidylprolyl isomerase [Brevundimonas basaltis]
MKFVTAAALSLSLLAAAPVGAQIAPAADWRTVAPENLLVIDTVHGRILVELEPRMAPQAVNRIRTLADQGFYDGLKFHRVISGFMAQTGDPQGTGQGGSDLPDLAAEFEFRRGREAGFVPVASTSGEQFGLIGSVPVVTQPDAQMMITADFKTGAQGLFCSHVAGMARGGSVDSANSQFFLMTGPKEDLNGRYTPFGRVVAGMDAVRAIKAGTEANNGNVADPDVMIRARTAGALPEGERPSVRVATGAALQAEVERVRSARGAGFNVCDVQPPAEVVGG